MQRLKKNQFHVNLRLLQTPIGIQEICLKQESYVLDIYANQLFFFLFFQMSTIRNILSEEAESYFFV